MKSLLHLRGGSPYPLVFTLFVLLVFSVPVRAQSPKAAPIMTRFAKDMDPAKPLPEYPRPQMVRADWLNLNGVWEYQLASEGETVPVGKPLSGKIIVPFPVESALSGVMEHHDRLWYRRTFTVPPAWKGRNVLLHFDAVDYEGEPFLNGHSLGVHRGGYDAFSCDMTPFLQGQGEQELLMRVFDPTDAGGEPRGKQSIHGGHIKYTPSTGIWQTVWLEPVAAASIQDVKIVPDVDASAVHITVTGTVAAKDDPVNVRIMNGDTTVQTVEGRAGAELTVPVANPQLWTPESPFLYDLAVSLKHGAQTSDSVKSYFGMRKISLGDDHGVRKMFLNNRFVFEFGPLDQGFWPDGLYTAPTDAALRSDIEAMKAAGFNMVRKHVKVEPQRWYYWCDKLGLMVWQDMPSANTYNHDPAPPPVDTEAFKTELQRMIETHWNHPSIIMWVAFNEGQGQHAFDTEGLVNSIKKLDPSRLADEASGGQHHGFGDVLDIHTYPEPTCPAPSATMALACGEYGGIGMKVNGHLWYGNKGSSYLDAVDPEDLLYYFGVYADSVRRYRDEDGLSAVVYTQLTDVEGEINGLLTYDRVPKVDLAKVAASTRPDIPPGTLKIVLADSEQTAQTWRYTETAPDARWSKADFDDNAWMQGEAGFGKYGTIAGRAPWHLPDLWLRKHFNLGKLSVDEVTHLVQRGFYTGDCELYINGVEAFVTKKKYTMNEYKYATPEYQTYTISEQARRALKMDADNVLAVHCQKGGEKFFDTGIAVLIPAGK